MRTFKQYLRIQKSDNGSDLGESGPRPDSRYWVTPTLMIGSFVVGIILAVAHHVYYTTLNNTRVGSAARQQWPIRFGTAFAFLFKTCLANATGIAYIQWVWRRCRQRAIRIDAIDNAFAADRNIFTLLDPAFVSKFPLAAGLMMILWCLPLSSLVTPATLGIASMPDTAVRTISVYHPTISSFDSDTNQIFSPRSGPSSKVRQMVTIMAATGELPRLRAPDNLQNISYTVDLVVPLVHCRVSNDQIRSLTALSAYEEAVRELRLLGNKIDTNRTTFHAHNLTFMPNIDPAIKGSAESLPGQIGYYATEGPTANNVGELWIAIANPQSGTLPHDFKASQNASYYTCSQRNSSVKTIVSFIDNVQSLEAVSIKDMEFVQMDPDRISGNVSTANNALDNYDTFGTAIFDILSGLVLKYWNPPPNHIWNTTLDQTIFGTSNDISVVTSAFKDSGIENGTAWLSRNLTTVFEEFYLNASLALMSLPTYNKKVPTQVTQTLWVNKYTYDPKNLLIAYGCSILACLVTIVIGGYAFHTSRESYDTRFSSISRVMQGLDVAAVFSSETTGTSMAKKSVAETKIRLLKNGTYERFCVVTEEVALNPI